MKMEFLSAVRNLLTATIAFFGDMVPTPREVAKIFFDIGVTLIKFGVLLPPACAVLTIAFIVALSRKKKKPL